MLISAEQNLKHTSVYTGFLLMKVLKKRRKITIFELYSVVKAELKILNYKNTIFALIFLHMNGLVTFDEPYIVCNIEEE